MAQEKGGGETGTECGVDKGVGDGWVVMWPGRSLVLEGDEESFGVGYEKS